MARLWPPRLVGAVKLAIRAGGALSCFFAREGATGCGLLYLAEAVAAAGAGCGGVDTLSDLLSTVAGLAADEGDAGAGSAIATSGCGGAGAGGAVRLATTTGALATEAGAAEAAAGAALAAGVADLAVRRAAKAADAASTVLGFSSGSGGRTDFGRAEASTKPSVPSAVAIFT